MKKRKAKARIAEKAATAMLKTGIKVVFREASKAGFEAHDLNKLLSISLAFALKSASSIDPKVGHLAAECFLLDSGFEVRARRRDEPDQDDHWRQANGQRVVRC